MYKNKTVGVVITAYNEEKFIEEVVNTIPPFADSIYAIDDGSTDATPRILSTLAKTNERLVVITHEKNKGAGAAKVSGYKKALKDKMDITVIMAGDGQTPPEYLDKILDPVVEGKADYSKGNRLTTREYRKAMPKFRLFGNFLLTWLTKIASGYWHVSDPEDGYTAMTRETMEKLNLDGLCKGWPAENDILVKLNVLGARVVDVPHPTTYEGRTSHIRYPSFIVATSWLLLKDFLWRLWMKYINQFFMKIQ